MYEINKYISHYCNITGLIFAHYCFVCVCPLTNTNLEKNLLIEGRENCYPLKSLLFNIN